MSRTKARLEEANAKAVKWKAKYQALKPSYERLKKKLSELGQRRGQDESDKGTLDSNNAFVRECYLALLGRPPSESELLHESGFAAVLDSGQWTREQVMWNIIRSEEFSQRQQRMEFAPPGHFYSAIPSHADRQRAMRRRAQQISNEIDMRSDDQMALLTGFLEFRQDCPFRGGPCPGFRYHYENGFFAWSDGFILHSMIRRFQPRRIVEVGSGYSSALMLDVREHLLKTPLDLTFVEPHAGQLRSLMKPGDENVCRVIEQDVQSVDPEVFRSLKESDMLFIDSTHVCKAGSDVNHLFFEVLPMLADGVLVHFHDIFYPFEYSDEWLAEGRAWNELYLLRAFLMHNKAYRVMLSSAFVHHQFRGWMMQNMPDLARNPGGSFWIQKNRDAAAQLDANDFLQSGSKKSFAP